MFRLLQSEFLLRFFRFAVVGSVATFVHMLVAFSFKLTSPHVGVYEANLLGFCFAFLVSFAGHRYYTFERNGSWAKFFVIAMAGFFVNNSIIWIGARLGINDLLCLFISIGLVPLFTYLGSSLWVFSK